MEKEPCLLLENNIELSGPKSDCSSVSFAKTIHSENTIIPVTKGELEQILKSNNSAKISSVKVTESVREDTIDKSFKDDQSEVSVQSEGGDETVISVTIKNGGHPKVQRYTSENLAEVEEVGPTDACCLKEGYKLGKEIGEGAYSCVRAAEVLPQKIEGDRKIAKLVQKNKHKWVAVKILNKNKAPTDYTTKFIGREIQALHRIRGHENVVEIYDVFETSDYLFIITELCQKGDLFHYINACADAGHTGLPEDQARAFFVQICNGMLYCHQRGVVHRDFKCENVLISDDEKTVKITDFGFACTVPNKRLMLSTPCGSYSYAAPEVLFGKSYDPFVSDVWSLGVVLFCMLNGTTPYGHVQLSLLEEYMSTQRLQFQRISPEAKHLLRQLLTYEPRKRPKIQDILKSPWVTRRKTHFVEKLCTPVVEDRTHLVGIVSRFNVPTTPNLATEHRQCINFSRICFSNCNESVSLKSRQPNRERDRHLHLIPILRRTRMSVVEFKERMGLNINQSQPMAQILKNIISGTNAAGIPGEEAKEANKNIPDLPANLSTQQGDTNQPMVEYLAEMWMDVDRTVVSTQESQESGQQPGQQQNVMVLGKRLDKEAANLSNTKTSETEKQNREDTEQIQDAIPEEEKTPTDKHVGKAQKNPAEQLTDWLEEGQKQEDVQTESSFCTCTNPDTGSTYTVHLPQPDEPPIESPPPTPHSRWPDLPPDRYGFPRGESRVATTTPVDQDWNNSTTGPGSNRLPRLENSRYTEHHKNSLVIAEKAKLINDKAERLLAHSRNSFGYGCASPVPKHVQKFNIEKVATKVQSFTLRKPLTNINKTRPTLTANNCKVTPSKQASWNKFTGKANVYQRKERCGITRATEERILAYQKAKDAAYGRMHTESQKPPQSVNKASFVEENEIPAKDQDEDDQIECDSDDDEVMDEKTKNIKAPSDAFSSKSKECTTSAPVQRLLGAGQRSFGANEENDENKEDIRSSYSQSKLESRPSSAELNKQESGDSIPTNGSESDEELRKIALSDPTGDQSPTKSPDNTQGCLIDCRKTDTASINQVLSERLSYLGQKKSDLDMCSPVPQSPDDPIYERHARTPVKEKPASRTITPDVIKKARPVRRPVPQPEYRNSESMMYGGHKYLRRGANVRASELKSEVKKLMKGQAAESKENRSLPVLQINKSKINKIDHNSVKRIFKNKPLSPTKCMLRKSKSPFPNPLTNPQLWQGTVDTMQITEQVRSTPTIACPLLPQKNNYLSDMAKRPYRIRLSETATNNTYLTSTGDKALFPPVTNLVFEDNVSSQDKEFPRKY